MFGLTGDIHVWPLWGAVVLLILKTTPIKIIDLLQ